ncbi:hypothetical protein [Nonomuraea sp. NPDC023979]|uniref:hypothetical protein n=1 Tax=Nonomuraea sp. NPDC023979 TaxID=3154796 RepID=UPI0033E1D3DA
MNLPPDNHIDQTWRISTYNVIPVDHADYAEIATTFQSKHRPSGDLGLIHFESPLYGAVYVDTAAAVTRYGRGQATLDLDRADGALYLGWPFTGPWERIRPKGGWWRDTLEGVIFTVEGVVVYEGSSHPSSPGYEKVSGPEGVITWHCTVCHEGADSGWVSTPSSREQTVKDAHRHLKQGHAPVNASLERAAAELASKLISRQQGRNVRIDPVGLADRSCGQCALINRLANQGHVARIF